MDDSGYQFFLQAIQTPSPSGYEQQIQVLVAEYLEGYAESSRVDVHGNYIATAGDVGGPRLMLAGHCDQIGMLVSHIDDEGFVYAQTIGGWDPQQLIGQSMTIWTDNGPLPAAISRKPIHLLTTEERGRVVRLDELWLDIGAVNGEAAREKIRIGDPITLDLRMRRLLGSLVSGPGMDNKSGMWTVVEALKRAVASPLQCHLHSVSTVQEEIGLRGAKTASGSIDPQVAIAVDVTHASDCPTISKQTQGDLRVGGGPVIFRGPNINPVVADRLIVLAEENNLPYQLAAIGRATPNDANVMQLHGGGVATGLVAIPNRYMHSAVEVISTEDLDVAAELLSKFAQALSASDDFTPRVKKV
ncbi:MAG: M42 family metallopeptidase [Rubripirellula sp.]|nr:M42 family metallopeptidase [Rubripirellula sp.]